MYIIKHDHSTQISYFISKKSNDTSTLWSQFSGNSILPGEERQMAAVAVVAVAVAVHLFLVSPVPLLHRSSKFTGMVC